MKNRSAQRKQTGGKRRCLVVADGFYEWQGNGRRKTPHYIRLRSGRPFGFAGVWSSHRTAVGTRSATCAILTCAPNELMAPIHNRMPVILPAGARDRWLDANAEADDLRALLTPASRGLEGSRRGGRRGNGLGDRRRLCTVRHGRWRPLRLQDVLNAELK